MQHLAHAAGPAPAAALDEPLDLQGEYEAMLRRLCRAMQLPEVDEPLVLETEAMDVSGVLMGFGLESWSGFVKVYADIGLPAPARAQEVYRTMLEQQLAFPAPVQMVVGLHPQTQRLLLYACAPLSTSSETDRNIISLLESCVAAVKLLRGDGSMAQA